MHSDIIYQQQFSPLMPPSFLHSVLKLPTNINNCQNPYQQTHHQVKQTPGDISTYKVVANPILEYASIIWSANTTTTDVTKIQTIQNKAIRITIVCTPNTNIQYLYDETNIPPPHTIILETSHIRLNYPTHTLHSLTKHIIYRQNQANCIQQLQIHLHM